MNKVYVVMACGGFWEESYDCILKIFANEHDAEEYREHFLSSPELLADYEDLDSVYISEWDVE